MARSNLHHSLRCSHVRVLGLRRIISCGFWGLIIRFIHRIILCGCFFYWGEVIFLRFRFRLWESRLFRCWVQPFFIITESLIISIAFQEAMWGIGLMTAWWELSSRWYYLNWGQYSDLMLEKGYYESKVNYMEKNSASQIF